MHLQLQTHVGEARGAIAIVSSLFGDAQGWMRGFSSREGRHAHGIREQKKIRQDGNSPRWGMTGMTRCPSGHRHRLNAQDPVPPLTASHVGLNIPTDVAMSMVRITAAHHVSVSTTVAVALPRWMESLPRGGQLASSNTPFKTRTKEVGDVELSGSVHMSRESRTASPERQDRLYEIDCQASVGIEKAQYGLWSWRFVDSGAHRYLSAAP